jgi:hypothetical protein
MTWFNDRAELAAFCRWMEDMGRAPLDRWELVQLAERYEAEHEEFVRWDAMERDAEENAVFEDDLRRRSAL